MGLLSCRRCNQPESLDSGRARWGKSTLRYRADHISYPARDPAQVAANYRRAIGLLESACGIRFVAAGPGEPADIVAVSSPIDGPWNTLAISELPTGDNFDGQLHQWFDQLEQLDDALMVAMMAHELGHCLGLGHLPPGNLMAPVLDPNILGPQPADVAELRARYGPPAAPAPVPDQPPAVATPWAEATPWLKPFDFQFTIVDPGQYKLVGQVDTISGAIVNPVLSRKG